MPVPFKRTVLTTTVASALAVFAAEPAPARAQSAPMAESYQLLMEKSIFSKDRRSAGSVANLPTQPVRVLSPEQSVAFRGVLCPDEEYVAFVENVQTGQISIVRTGDELARGRVAAITLDTLAYDAGGKLHYIQLGQNLAGEVAGATIGAAVSAASPTSSPAGAAPVPSDPATAAIIERMKQRKLQEGGR